FSATTIAGTTRGSNDVSITKLNAAGTGIVWSALFGGSGDDRAFGIAVNKATGEAYLTGLTSSTNFPLMKSGVAGQAVQATFGGNSDDRGAAIAVDSAGKAYVTGFQISGNFPTKAGGFQTTLQGSWDAFVSKFDATQTGANSLVYSTNVGSSYDEYAQGIAVDAAGNAYVTGIINGSAPNFPVVNAVQPTPAGGSGFDGFITKLNASGSALIYSTFYGGQGGDRPQAITVDAAG